MTRCTAEERALARASIYRLLALAFTYPTAEVREALAVASSTAAVAATLIDEETTAGVSAIVDTLGAASDLERAYQQVFTLSYSEDCPPYETAFSAQHIFQQTQQQADLAGFYRAFGVDSTIERSDHIALELEFCYLLALKEAHARDAGDTEHVTICRQAQRSFARDHLLRWAPLIGQRVAVSSREPLYQAAGHLLATFSNWEERFLRLGAIERYRNEPIVMADEPGEFSCPYGETVMAGPVDLPFVESIEEVRGAFTAPE